MTTTVSATHPNNFSQLKCSPSTLICREKTVILGDVTIGPDCVIHPTVSILAREGPIIIGSNNLIEERVVIVNSRQEPMIIGDHNVFEVDTCCEAPRIGNHNVLESKSKISPHVELTDNCIIGAGCEISNQKEANHGEMRKIQPYTVVSGKDLTTRVVEDLPTSWQTSQLEFLRKILPNYQKLWRPGGLAGTPQHK